MIRAITIAGAAGAVHRGPSMREPRIATVYCKIFSLKAQVNLLLLNVVASYSICDVLYWQHNIATQRDYAMRTCALISKYNELRSRRVLVVINYKLRLVKVK